MRATILFLLPLFVLTGCIDVLEGTGPVMSESRTLEAFEVIDSRSSADVTVHQTETAEQPKVVVKAQENLLPHIQTVVQGTRLVIDTEGSFSTSEGIVVEVYTPVITKLVNDGSGNMDTASRIRAKELEVINQGSGNMMVGFNGDDIEVTNEGSGDIRLIGECRDAELTNEGSGDIEANELIANKADAVNEGSGNVYVHAIDELSIELSGSGNVEYEGDPQNLETANSGSGKIDRD